MADSIVAGLFGPQPWQIEQAQQQAFDQTADRYAQMTPFQQASGMLFRGGGGLARGGAQMAGMQTPQMAQAQRTQQILSQIDTTTAEGLAKGAMLANQAGDPKLAFMLAQAAQQKKSAEAQAGLTHARTLAELKKAQTEASPIAKINPKDYTQDSIRKYMQSHNPADLEAVNPDGKMSQKYLQLKEAYGDDSATISAKMKEWIEAEIKGTKGTSVSVTIGKGDEKYSETRLKDVAEQITALGKSAETAYISNQALDRFLEASKKGTQGGAQPVISMTQNFLSSFGYSPESLKDVRQMEQAIGDILGSKMKELGARGLTDKDMDVLRQALPRVNTDRTSRENVVAILKKANDFVLNEYSNAREEESRIYPELSNRIPNPAWFKAYKETGKVATVATPEQAKAMYESGRISKDDLKAILKDMRSRGLF